MKKKLEAELISIAHRILKLKNRAELDVLQQETLKLYEKISVLRFVEDNFSEVKPTIGHASAEEKLEEIYGIEEIAPVHANEQETKEDEARAEKKAEKEAEAKSQKPKAEEEEEEMTATDKPEGDADPDQKVEEYQASEEEKEHTEEETDEEVEEVEKPQAGEEAEAKSHEPQGEVEKSEDKDEQPETEAEEPESEEEEPAVENKIEVVKPAEDVKAMEASAAAVYEKEDNSTPEEEEQAADAEIKTIEPYTKAKVQNSGLGFDFAFERNAVPDEPKKQKEITFEDYHDYKEPEFIKKDDPQSINKEFLPKEPEVALKQEENANAFSEAKGTEQEPKAEEPVRDWRDWEPAKSEEPKAEEPKATSQQPQADMPTTNYSQQQTTNDKPQTTNLKTINLGLNDRIAFEKNLFGGSGEDLNRVLSQLNTMDRFDDAQNFINDLVKPDYNNWQGKEEYEERFIQLVEKRFS